jgi:murein DD-endopeptidase MepM/ murein hydrolase activator NlpD
MRKLFASLLAISLLTSLVATADASFSTKDSLKNQIASAGDAVDEANAQVTKALRQYNKAAAALPAARQRLATATTNLAKAQNEHQTAVNDLAKSTAATGRAEESLSSTQSNLSTQNSEVSKLVNMMYRQGPMSELSIIFSTESPAEFTTRIQIVKSWFDSKTAQINQLTKTREDLIQKKKALDELVQDNIKKKADAQAKVLTAEEAAKEAKAAQAAVNKIVNDRKAAFDKAKKFQAQVQKRYDKLKKEQQRLKKIAKKNNGKGKNLDPSDQFLWPVAGAPKTSNAGMRLHPIFKIWRCHAGIDLGASTGARIRATEDGVVADVGWSTGYGNYVMLAHGKGITSFYAHMSQKLAKDGESVSRGETIGLVGSTGWSTGPHLHFEIRVYGELYDPMGWFGHSKKKIC